MYVGVSICVKLSYIHWWGVGGIRAHTHTCIRKYPFFLVPEEKRRGFGGGCDEIFPKHHVEIFLLENVLSL